MFHLKHELRIYLTASKSSEDVDQLILALIFRFGVILSYKIAREVKFSRVFIRYKDTH